MPSFESPVTLPTYRVCGLVGETRTSCGPSKGGNPGRGAQVRAPSVDLNSDTVNVAKSTASTYSDARFEGSTAQSRGNTNGPIAPVDRQFLPRSSVRKTGRPRATLLKLYTVEGADPAWQKPLANGSRPAESTNPFIARCHGSPRLSVRWKPGLPEVASTLLFPSRATPSLALVKNNPGSGVTSLACPIWSPRDANESDRTKIPKQNETRMDPPLRRKPERLWAAPRLRWLLEMKVRVQTRRRSYYFVSRGRAVVDAI